MQMLLVRHAYGTTHKTHAHLLKTYFGEASYRASIRLYGENIGLSRHDDISDGRYIGLRKRHIGRAR